MSVTDRVTKLSKYMISLPKSRISILLIMMLSFFTGGIIGCLTPGMTLERVVYSFLSGGATFFFLFGLTSIASGALIHSAINSLNKRHVKLKQALFISFLSMLISCVVYFIGVIISLILHVDILLNSLLLGILFGFTIETLVVWSTSNIKFRQGVLISAVQPVLILSMLVLINYLTEATTSLNSVVSLYLKAIIGALVLTIAVYSFVVIIESPMRNNLGVGGLELLSLFIAQFSEGSNAMEEVFSLMGEAIDTTVSLISFKNKKGNIKANYISPCVHPGPVGSIGGGNLPTILANELNDFSIIAHGAATHDFNPVAAKEIHKITTAINEILPTLEYSNKASKFQRVSSQEAKIGAQRFNDGIILLSTFAPNSGDDIDYGVGLSMIHQTQYVTGAKNVVLVDCHNSLEGNYDRLMAGHNRTIQIEDAISKLEKQEFYPIKMGYAFDPVEEVITKDGLADSGIKIMITEVDNQKMLYAVFDGNNMKRGLRSKIFNSVKEKYPEIDMIEVMTTDTHMVNTISGGGITVGSKQEDVIIKHLLDLIPEALNDLEEVSVASGTARVNINTLGPNHSTELVTTITSIVSVSKLLAPLVFIMAAIITILWLF